MEVHVIVPQRYMHVRPVAVNGTLHKYMYTCTCESVCGHPHSFLRREGKIVSAAQLCGYVGFQVANNTKSSNLSPIHKPQVLVLIEAIQARYWFYERGKHSKKEIV